MTNVVTLDEVRTHLRYPIADTQDDGAFQLYMDAADQAIRRECGDIVPQTYDDYYDGGTTSIFLIHTPILSVEGVEEGWGTANYVLDQVQVNTVGSGSMFAYSIDNEETGIITRRTAGNVVIPFMRGSSNIRVTYTAGRLPVPSVIKLATLELIAFWWQNSQQRAFQQTTQYGYGAVDQDAARSGPSAGEITMNLGVPWKIIEMIKAYRSAPIIG
jgi:hypothetical protein